MNVGRDDRRIRPDLAAAACAVMTGPIPTLIANTLQDIPPVLLKAFGHAIEREASDLRPQNPARAIRRMVSASAADGSTSGRGAAGLLSRLVGPQRG